jgi:protein-tyrosine phosphatase/nicotinamidase-related amidase
MASVSRTDPLGPAREVGTTVLLTQCLQRDFVDPIRPGDPLPNRLHVGSDEARRLLGDDPEHSALAQLLAWARANTNNTVLIHVRDWHDPSDPAQAPHLATFGPHCLRDTPGAELCIPGDDAGAHIIDATGLNDLEGTGLFELLSALPRPLRVGVIGVWTDAKVSFNFYDLATRLGVTELATCSALTASNARSRHFYALDQLERLLGVRVFHDVAGFADWLSPGARPAPTASRRAGPTIEPELPEADAALISHLFRDSATVHLDPLAGGFSGARVYRARSTDTTGHRQADTVVKLGPTGLIGPERAATERIAEILGNNLPTIRGYVDFGDRAGLRLAWAAMGQGSVRTLKKMWEQGVEPGEIGRVLTEALEEVLGPFWEAARYERLPLVEHLQFVRWATNVCATVDGLRDRTGDTLDFPGLTVRDLRATYADELLRLPYHPGELRLVSQLHGDLNFANVLVDARDNVWVIDFARSGPGPILQDLAKLENDLLYILTPVPDEEALAEALKITTALRAVGDLRSTLPEESPSALYARTWAVLRVLRGIAARICREERSPTVLQLLLLRYAAHTLTFDEASPLQKQWALASACAWAEDAFSTLLAAGPLRVEEPIPGVGLTILPGRRDKGRDLAADLETLVRLGVRRLVTLPTDAELAWYGVPDLVRAARLRGLEVLHVPIVDQGVPTIEEARTLSAWIRAGVDAGERVVVHCVGGLGRSGLVAACVLLDRGATPDQALAMVRATRGPRAVESAEQEAFVRWYRW